MCEVGSRRGFSLLDCTIEKDLDLIMAFVSVA